MSRSDAVEYVGLPRRVWGRLASEADHRGVEVGQLLADAVSKVIRRSYREAVVIGMAVQGHSDRVIGELTGESAEFIKRARRGVGIVGARERR